MKDLFGTGTRMFDLSLEAVATLMNSGQFKEAIGILRPMIRGESDHSVAGLLCLRRAQCYLNIGDLEKSISDFTQCIDSCQHATKVDMTICGLVSEAFVGRGIARMRSNDIDSALNDFSSALRLNSNHHWALYGRALIRAKCNDRSGALEDLKRASDLSLNSSDTTAYRQIREEIDSITLGNNVREFAGEVVGSLIKKSLLGG